MDAAKPNSSAEVPEASEQPEDDRPNPRDLVQRLRDMHPKAQAAPDPQRAKLTAALTQVAELIKGAKLAEAAELLEDGAAQFHRQLVFGDLASEYDNELRVWLEELD